VLKVATADPAMAGTNQNTVAVRAE
jgi:hypothetical protein